jgi:hypothetical protein
LRLVLLKTVKAAISVDLGIYKLTTKVLTIQNLKLVGDFPDPLGEVVGCVAVNLYRVSDELDFMYVADLL